MKREELVELQRKKVSFKFMTRDGTVVTCKRIIETGHTTLLFFDKFGKTSFIGYRDIKSPVQVLTRDYIS
jgi:hypothetical protein